MGHARGGGPVTQAEMLARIDAVVSEYQATAGDCATPRLAAIRSPRATWCAVYTHAAHQLARLPAPEVDNDGR